MFNKTFIGHTFEDKDIHVEMGKLQFFSKVIGEKNPIYFNEKEALKQGYRSILAPLTYIFSLTLEQESYEEKYGAMGIDLQKLLHGEQRFEYSGDVCAGDIITISSKIVDIFTKKNSSLDFMIEEMNVKNKQKENVAILRQTLLMRI